MNNPLLQQVDAVLGATAEDQDSYATTVVQGLLEAAADLGASDLHLQPTRQGLELQWRIDGVLHTAGAIGTARAANVIARLKVLATLLTYRSEAPQEGRIRDDARALEFRVSTFPTLHGEKAAIRLVARRDDPYESLDQLHIDEVILSQLRRAATATSGAILLVGPAGSGKTTTAYTLLREIRRASAGGRSITTLEDPIEAAVDGVVQSQINSAAGFDLLSGLRSLVRQDPEVIFIGEIRDAEVAKVAYQAAMTGQLVVTTFHATDAADALARLADMGIPPYVLRGATRLVVAQRLLRRACPACTDAAETGHAISRSVAPQGADPQVGEFLNQSAASRDSSAWCDACRGTGFRGRVPAAEAIDLRAVRMGSAVLRRSDANVLRRRLADAGHRSLLDQARSLVARRVTTQAELIRLFGLTASTESEDGD